MKSPRVRHLTRGQLLLLLALRREMPEVEARAGVEPSLKPHRGGEVVANRRLRNKPGHESTPYPTTGLVSCPPCVCTPDSSLENPKKTIDIY